MYHYAIEEKIRTEAARAGIQHYTVQEDLLVFTTNNNSGVNVLEVNTPNLIVFFGPEFYIKYTPGMQDDRLRKFTMTGSIESKSLDLSEAKPSRFMEREFVFGSDPVMEARYSFPFMAVSKNATKLEIYFNPNNVVDFGGFIRAIHINPSNTPIFQKR